MSGTYRLPRSSWDSPSLPTLTGVLGVALVVGILAGPLAGAGILALGVLAVTRPFEPLFAALITVSASTLVDYNAGHLTRELAVVVGLAGFTGFCVLVSSVAGRWALPGGGLPRALFWFGVTTLISLAFGLLRQNPLKHLGLDLLPLLGLGFALIVGGLRLERSDRALVLAVLIPTGLIHVALGFHSYVVLHMRTGGIYFTPIPGMLALLLINLALYSRSRRLRLAAGILVSAFLIHQFISFTRGYWMGLLVSIPLSVLLYVLRRREGEPKLGRILEALVPTAALAILGLAVVGTIYGWDNLLESLTTRFVSSVGVQQSSETASNVARLVEYSQVLKHIATSPWIGHGLGYTILIDQPIMGHSAIQALFHQVYLWMWVKQGILGLLAFLVVLWAAVRVGWTGAKRGLREGAGWCAAATACTVHLAVVGLTHYPFAQVNDTFLLALLWGIAMGFAGVPMTRIVWREGPARFSEASVLPNAPGR